MVLGDAASVAETGQGNGITYNTAATYERLIGSIDD